MAKAESAKKAPPAATSTEAKKPEGKLVILKKDLKFRGARQKWYERLIGLEGKTLTVVLEDLEKDRPSVYGAKSKHAGNPEPVAGWVRFYVRNGYMEFK